MLRPLVFGLAAGLMASGPGLVSGQAYPNKPVRIVTAEAGGGNDFAARLIAEGLAGGLGQPVIVENRGGAGGAIAAELVAKAQPDGYTLITYASNFYIVPLMKKVPYDVVKDFAPVTAAGIAPNVVVVPPSLPAKSIKELIALAKAKPGELNYADGSTGGSQYLATELFKSMAGVNIVAVTYKGNGPAITALIAGQVQMMLSSAIAAAPSIKSGKLKALAVTSAKPSTLAPELPTVAASGLPGYEAISVYSVYAPARTPAAIINRLNREAVRFLNRADVKERLLSIGVEAVGSSPAELAAIVKSDMTRLARVIKDTGIKID